MARIDCECMAVIPARSGSKGPAGKNIKELCGKPLLAWTIEAALESSCFDPRCLSRRTPLSTEPIAKAWGAEVVYRDQRLATSSATTFMVLEDLLRNKVCPSKLLTLLQPTSPLRTSSQIADAMRLITLNFAQYDFVASVSLAEHASHLVHPLAADGSLAFFDIDYSNYRRQDSAEYSPNGAIFIAKPDEYLAQGHFFGEKSLAYIMDKESSVDVDDDIDFALAELCMTRRLLDDKVDTSTKSKVAFATGSRADYGIVRRYLKLLDDDPAIDLSILVTGALLEQAYGHQVDIVKEDGFSIGVEVPLGIDSLSEIGVAHSMARALRVSRLTLLIISTICSLS